MCELEKERQRFLHENMEERQWQHWWNGSELGQWWRKAGIYTHLWHKGSSGQSGKTTPVLFVWVCIPNASGIMDS